MKKTFGSACRFLFVFFAFTAAFSFCAGRVQASATEYVPDMTPVRQCGDYDYKVYSDGTVGIVDYRGRETDVVIPTELDGSRVTEIGSQAFAYYEMASLSIPEGIDVTGRAFEYCKIRDRLDLAAGITVRISAFEYASLPEAVMIPEGAVIEGDSFSYCKKLVRLFVEPEAAVKGSAFSYSKELKTLVCAPGAEITERAFYSSRQLTEVVLCGEVRLGDEPFPYCSNARQTAEKAERYEQEAEQVFGPREKPEESVSTSKPADRINGRKLGKEAVLIAALDDAGVRPRDIRDLKIEPKQDSRGDWYEVSFKDGSYQYEYEIDAYSGEIQTAKKAKQS